MAETVKNRICSALQHSFCSIHHDNFIAEYWKEINMVAKFIERTSREDLANRMLVIFPEAPAVCTPEKWQRFSELICQEHPCPWELSNCSSMIQQAKSFFQICKQCRMWSGRMVEMNDEERADLTDTREAVENLENQVDYLQEEVNKASRKKRRLETTVDILQGEIRRLQYLLSKSRIPIEVKNTYGALYRHLFEAEEVPEISTNLMTSIHDNISTNSEIS